MKLTVSLVVALAIGLLVASPALGKGVVVERVVAGEGGDAITLATSDIPSEAQTELVSGIMTGKGMLSEEEVGEDLGAVVLLATTISTRPGGKDDVLEQELYPFAEGGALVFTPQGQKRHAIGKSNTIPVKSGWRPYPQDIVDLLVEEGLGATVLAAPPPSTERTTPPLAWGILIGSIVLAAVMFTVGIKRSSA